MDFAETAEQAAAALVGGRSWPPATATRTGWSKARAGEKTDELWAEAGRLGYLGVNVPEEYGGGGGGIVELAIVCEELAAAGCPLLLLVVSPGHLRHGHRPVRHRRAEASAGCPGIAGGALKMAFAHHRAGRRLQLPPHHHHRPPGRRRLAPHRPQDYISGVDEADAVLVVGAHRGRADRHAAAGAVRRADGRARLRADADPGGDHRAGEAVRAVLRRRAAAGRRGRRRDADAALRAAVRRAQPGADHGAAFASASAGTRWTRRAAYARSRQVWGVPIGAHQGVAHPLANAAIQVELARLMTQKAGLALRRRARMPGGRGGEHGQVRGGGGVRCSRWTRRSRSTAATAWPPSTVWPRCGALARLARTAPVSREMILNFVASHTLGLPRSY